MAIKASNCEYITNANTDDHIYQGSYAIMAKVLNDDHTIGVVYGDENQVSDKEIRLKQRPQGDFELLKTKCFVGPMPMWRKSLHDDYGYFGEKFKVCGDYEFWLRLGSHGVKFHHIPQALGMYTKRSASLEHRDPLVTLAEDDFVKQLYRGIDTQTNFVL
jgi:hypothetical protein